MKNDSRLQAIVDAANEWVDADQSNRSCIILTHDEIGHPFLHYYFYADDHDMRNMLYEICVNAHDFYRAVKEAIEDYETEQLGNGFGKIFES